MSASGDQSDFSVGQRVEYQGFYGTVRYSGEVSGQSGIWIGVEWDDPERGKHDGSHSGVSYFKTSHPTSGSLLRPEKLNGGISCVEAIKNKYGRVESSMAGIDKDTLLDLQKELNAPFVEMVGFEKVNSQQSQFEKLMLVYLDNELVRSPGEQLGLLYPSIVELTLVHTLINSWKTVGEIAVQLPHLVRLDVSNNILPVPSEEEALNLVNSFQSIRHIALSSLGYSWKNILTCSKMWPSITTLEAHSNSIQHLESPPVGVFSSLTSLFLQNNSIAEWEQVNTLGSIHSLQLLQLGKNCLRDITFPGERSTSLFESLIELSLTNNEIHEWCAVNELNKLKSLRALFFMNNPLMEEPNAFEMIVSRIKGLKYLNHSSIFLEDRKGAEYYYLRKFGSQWLSIRDDPVLSKVFGALHPRYVELMKDYGSFDDDELAEFKPVTLKSKMLNLKIFCPSRPNMPEFHKRVPKNMTVQKLVGLVQKLFNTDGCQPFLQAISTKAPDVEVSLEKDMQDLSFYSIEDGDSIAVSW